jgi:CTP synthase (UTP-ammonia lyase)
MLIEEHGYVGNIWVRQNFLEKKGDKVGGHTHLFDHVSLLAKGSVSVVIDGHEPKVFTAPTFIVIRKDRRHEITALEDETYWYCVFAARDVDGNVVDIVDTKNEPWFTAAVTPDFWDKTDTAIPMTRQRFTELRSNA